MKKYLVYFLFADGVKRYTVISADTEFKALEQVHFTGIYKDAYYASVLEEFQFIKD